jgi:hypothetical protein
MKIETALPAWAAVCLLFGQVGFGEGKYKASFASANQFVPALANNPGQFGAYFKTRLSVLNVTDFTYSVYVTFFNKIGKKDQKSFSLSPREMKNWDNFLDAFGYAGAGAVEFDSWFDPPGGSSDFEFLISSETYTDSANGRYKTVVEPGESIGASFPAYSVGVSVNASERTNLGCYNSGFSAQIVFADLHSSSGQLLKTYSVPLESQGWNQIGLADQVTNGYIRWRSENSCSCWAVVVDNRSNDGSFIPAKEYIQ